MAYPSHVGRAPTYKKGKNGLREQLTKEINKNIEITNTLLKMTQLNKPARRDVEKTRLREKSRLQTNACVRMTFLTKMCSYKWSCVPSAQDRSPGA